MVNILPLDRKIDAAKCAGDWYVQKGIPAANFLEKHAHNAKENYAYDENTQRLAVTYTFNDKSFDGKLVKTYQKGRVMTELGTEWAVRPYLGFICLPCYLPCELPYYILDVDEAYSYLVASAPDGGWMYIMTREQCVKEADLRPYLDFVSKLGFDERSIKTFPQRTDAEDAWPEAS